MKRDHFDDVKHDNWSLKQFFFKFPDISGTELKNPALEYELSLIQSFLLISYLKLKLSSWVEC